MIPDPRPPVSEEDRIVGWAFVALVVTLLLLCTVAFLEGWYGL